MTKKQPDPHELPPTDEEKSGAEMLASYIESGLPLMLQRTAIGKVPVCVLAGIDPVSRTVIPFAIMLTDQLMNGTVDEPRGMEHTDAPPAPKIITLEQHRKERLN